MEQQSNEPIAALIRKIEEGDPSALMLLYDATNRLVFGLLVRILGPDRASAEEALLDVYTQIWKNAGSYDPELTSLEWVLTIARMSAVARLNWSKRENRKPESPAGSTRSAMTVAPEKQKLARSSFDSLPPVQRELLEWAYYGGISCSEMAAQVGKPVGAVKSHLRLGLIKLGESIGAASGAQ